MNSRILALAFGLSALTQGCQEEGSNLNEAATANSVKTGIFAPQAITSLSHRSTIPKSAVTSVQQFKTKSNLSFKMDPKERSYFSATKSGETIMFLEPEDKPVYPFASIKNGKTFAFKPIGFILAGKLIESRRFYKYEVGAKADQTTTNQYFMRQPFGESSLVPWLRHITTESGIMLYRVGNAIFSAKTDRPVIGYQLVSSKPSVWEVAGSYKDGDLSAGALIWSTDYKTYYSIDPRKKGQAVKWVKQDNDSLDRDKTMNSSELKIPSSVKRLLQDDSDELAFTTVEQDYRLVDSAVTKVIAQKTKSKYKANPNAGGFSLQSGGDTLNISNRHLSHVDESIQGEFDVSKENWQNFQFENVQQVGESLKRGEFSNGMHGTNTNYIGYHNGKPYVLHKYQARNGKSTGPSRWSVSSPASALESSEGRVEGLTNSIQNGQRHLAKVRAQADQVMDEANKLDANRNQSVAGAMTDIVGNAGIQTVSAMVPTNGPAESVLMGAAKTTAQNNLENMIRDSEGRETIDPNNNVILNGAKSGGKKILADQLKNSTKSFVSNNSSHLSSVPFVAYELAQGDVDGAVNSAFVPVVNGAIGKGMAGKPGGIDPVTGMAFHTLNEARKEIDQQARTGLKFGEAFYEQQNLGQEQDTQLMNMNAKRQQQAMADAIRQQNLVVPASSSVPAPGATSGGTDSNTPLPTPNP